MKNFCVVIQGPSNYVPILKEKWSGVDLIWSTWIGAEGNYTADDVVVFSEVPNDRGVHNLYMQSVSTLNGIKLAKERGYENVIKMRSDQYPTNPTEFIKLFDETKINFFTYDTNTNRHYLVDYFMGGSISDIEYTWNIPPKPYSFPEEAITQKVFGSYLEKKINYIKPKITESNDIFWLGRNFGLFNPKQ
jgi:hypothetical protein